MFKRNKGRDKGSDSRESKLLHSCNNMRQRNSAVDTLFKKGMAT